jgi:hypothetical protein
VHSRVVAKANLGSREAENAEIERILTELGYTFETEPHFKGGLWISVSDDQIDDLEAFVIETTEAGLLHVF